jgi:TonB family protein
MYQEKKRTIALVFVIHVVFILAIGFFASRSGMLGKRMQALSVILVPKEKPVEIPKPKTEIPVVKTPQITQPKQTTPLTETVKQQTSPVSVAAPPPSEIPSIQFNDGAKDIQTITDPIELYKSTIEVNLKSVWQRPDDSDKSVMVQLTINEQGKIVNTIWLNSSGDRRWDASIKDVFNKVKSISRPPPKGFPLTFKVQFDTVME